MSKAKKIPRKAPCPTCGAARRSVAPEDLAAARHRAGLTLRQLADQSGLSHGHLGDVESGRRKPSAGIVELYEGLGGRP